MCHKCECAGAGIAAFLLGALVGAAAGVLLAPAKGEVTRRKDEIAAKFKKDEE